MGTDKTNTASIHQVSYTHSTNPNCDAVIAIKHTINQLYTMDKQDLIKYQDHMCMAMNIIRDRHINDKRNFKGKPQFLKFCHNCGRHGHSISKCPTYTRRKTSRPQSSLNTQTFHKHMTSNQDLPNKKSYTNNSTGKPLKEAYPHRYKRSNSRDSNYYNRQNG